MNRRSKLVLIGLIYGLALAGLLLAGAAVAGILPFGPRQTSGATRVAMIAATRGDQSVPALRPIWPPNGSAVPLRRSTRTPTATRRSQVDTVSTAATQPAAVTSGLSTAAADAGAAPLPGGTSRPGTSLGESPLPVPVTTPEPGAVATVLSSGLAPAAVSSVAATTLPGTSAATGTPGSTGAAGRGRISGRILVNNAPPSAPLQLTLEDQSYQVRARTTTGDGGSYAFADVPDSAEGYNVVFSQELNPESQIDRLATWAWLGPVPVSGGQATEVPAFDIALLGFQPSIPAPDGVVSGAAPVRFSWAGYPGATEYWLDLSKGDDQQNAWQSPFQLGTTATWDGMVNGQRNPGTYWWGVGARRPVASYKLVVYSYLIKFTLQ